MMSTRRGYAQQWQSGYSYDPQRAICAVCHRRPCQTTVSLSISASVTSGGMRHSSARAYHNIPVCGRCARSYRLHRGISRATGVLFLLAVVATFGLAMLAPPSTLEGLVQHPPVLAALITIVVSGLFNLLHYAVFLYPYPRRVEKWLHNRRLQGRM